MGRRCMEMLRGGGGLDYLHHYGGWIGKEIPITGKTSMTPCDMQENFPDSKNPSFLT
jgi:hypothetical protein